MEHPIVRYVQRRRKRQPAYTQADLAEEVGRSRQLITNVISGRTGISGEVLTRMNALPGGGRLVRELLEWMGDAA